MKISELMTPNIETVRETDSCREAAVRMCRAKVRHLPVIDRTGRLVGIVTDRDLRHRLFSPPVFRAIGTVPVESLLKIPVTEVMSSPVATTGVDDELETAAARMLENKIGSLVVVDRGRVAGIVTETDLLRRIVQADISLPELDVIVSYP